MLATHVTATWAKSLFSPRRLCVAAAARKRAKAAPRTAPKPRKNRQNIAARGIMQTHPALHDPTAEGSPFDARIAVVGDVHGLWCPTADAAAIAHLQPDMVLLVGDFGEEHVRLVRQVAALAWPKAVILGNHDAWWGLTHRRKSSGGSTTPQPQPSQPAGTAPAAAAAAAAEGLGDRPADGPLWRQYLQQPNHLYHASALQLEALGDEHVGYGSLAVPGKPVTIAGARPFSKGGPAWGSSAAFYQDMYSVDSFEASAQRILNHIQTHVPTDHALLVMAHAGPAGLGSKRHNINGVDWKEGEGDWGDVDLAAAVKELAAAGRPPAAVVCGHMHHELRGSGLRQMVAVDAATGTVHINSAVVPRVVNPVKLSAAGLTQAGAALGKGEAGCTARHFVMVGLAGGQVEEVADVWVSVLPVQSAAQQELSPGTAAEGSNSSSSSNNGNGSTSSSGWGAGRPCVDAAYVQAALAEPGVYTSLQQQKGQQVLCRTAAVQPLLVTKRAAEGEGAAAVKVIWDGFHQKWQQVVVGVRAARTCAVN